jgi:hypothetical protein
LVILNEKSDFYISCVMLFSSLLISIFSRSFSLLFVFERPVSSPEDFSGLFPGLLVFFWSDLIFFCSSIACQLVR